MATHTEYTKKAQAWRKAHGAGKDKDMIKAVRDAGYDREITDFDIIEAVGYADTDGGAVKKVRQWVRDNEIEAQEQAGEPAGEPTSA